MTSPTRPPRPPLRASTRLGRTAGPVFLALAAAVLSHGAARADGAADAARFRETVQPLLADYCYGCHGEGRKKGNVALDGFANGDPLALGRDAWWAVLKNVRSGQMPPADKPKPTAEELRPLEDWIKTAVFKTDPKDPDPGRVTLRRLNRVEYRNTIRDLMGVDFNTDEEFPPDDTGYGFDTIGDVLTVSPLLLEKYLQAAETVVTSAVPTVSKVVRVVKVTAPEFRGGDARGSRLSFYEPAKVEHSLRVSQAGRRRIVVSLNVDGAFTFDPGRCRVTFTSDGQELLKTEYGWQDNKTYRYEYEQDWAEGPHKFALSLEPLTPADQKKEGVQLRVVSVDVEGPLDRKFWVTPKNFERFFTQDDPGTPEARKVYARETLRKFAGKAFRRPVDDKMLDRLVGLAEETYRQPGKTVEEGIARAMVAVLASPRFVFRVEGTIPDPKGGHPLLDEYALASRLSYFLWSTMPDDELTELAAKGELRKNLGAQVRRLLDDYRSERLVKNFVGQWLQARDVETVPVDARVVLARDDGEEKELKQEQEAFRAFLAERDAAAKKAAAEPKKADQPKGQQAQGTFGLARRSGRFRRLFAPPRVDLDTPLRDAMRRETEMFFTEVVKKDRSVLELIDSDYTFLNERLAKFYGVPGVKGDYMRRVSLPEGSVRGGVLTQGTVLVVTSNPTRTSPVKRGLFVLDNILGTPAPPAPPNVPQLEEAEKGFEGREPTLREVLEIHRQKPLCNACHSRMDPLGLALESFNAMGLYREKERGQPLDTAGTLMTGEKFDGIKGLKAVLKDKHRADFYRCLTEKLLTYALGRGLEATDVESVDRIVARLESDGGKFSALLTGVIESAPFQKRRNVPGAAAAPGVTGPAAAAGSAGGQP